MPNNQKPKPSDGVNESSSPGYSQIRYLIEKESDRGAILILAANIEEMLGSLLIEACTSKRTAEAILKNGQPAGTFEYRVLLCQALGLIHEQEVSALRIIQKIRNKAAHFDRSGRGFNVLFDSSATVDQVFALLILLEYDKPDNNPSAVRESFVKAAQHVTSILAFRKIDIKEASLPKAIKDIATEFLAQTPDAPAQKDFSTPDYHMILCGILQLRKFMKSGLSADAIKNNFLALVKEEEEEGLVPPGTTSLYFREEEG